MKGLNFYDSLDLMVAFLADIGKFSYVGGRKTLNILPIDHGWKIVGRQKCYIECQNAPFSINVHQVIIFLLLLQQKVSSYDVHDRLDHVLLLHDVT